MPEHHSFLYGPVNRLLIHLLGPPPVEKMSPGAAAFFFPDGKEAWIPDAALMALLVLLIFAVFLPLAARRYDRQRPGPGEQAGPERQAKDQPDQGRRDGEENQRPRHHRRRLVDVRLDVRIDPALAPERQAHQPEHVEGRHQGDDHPDRPDPREA